MAKGVVVPGDLARELTWTAVGRERAGWTVVANEQHSRDRWESHHRLIIQNESGDTFAADYTRGLTEYQDSQPFGDAETVTFKQVTPRTIEVIEYA